jgi:hypothetical protein
MNKHSDAENFTLNSDAQMAHGQQSVDIRPTRNHN